MTRNIALLQRGIELVVEAEARDAFNQQNWIWIPDGSSMEKPIELDCKTAGCYAGHLVMDEGYRTVVWVQDGDEGWGQQCLVDAQGNTLTIEDDWIDDTITIAEHVRSRLGITYDEAEALFHHANTTQDLKHLVDRLCAGEDITPLYDHRGRRQTEGEK